jgi:HEAT repeat protein
MSNIDPYFLHLLSDCRDPDHHKRMEALKELSERHMGQVKADFLLFLLHRARRYDEQTAILSMLSQLGPRAPIDELTEIFNDRSDENPFPRGYVANVLASLGERAPLDLFISVLQDPTEEAGIREDMAMLLGQFGERVPLEVLIAAVEDEEPAVCAAGIDSLIEQGARAPLEPILAQLSHPEWYVRKAAVRALSFARERAPIEPIMNALNDPDARVREAAAIRIDILLEWFGTRVPLAPLIAALDDENESVRESALDTLANHPEYAPVDLITAALRDTNAYVRCAALLVFERMESSRVPEDTYQILLEIAAMDPYPNARKFANKTILTLKGFQLGRGHRFSGDDIAAM